MDLKINNLAIIQYQVKKGDIKILALQDYDARNLNRKVGCHMGTKRVLSVQFYYGITTNEISKVKKGVVLK